MVSFVHISDTHFSTDYSGQNIMLLYEKTGILPTEQFAIGMEHINRNYPDVDFFLLTGDIVQDGTAEEYTRFRGYIYSLTGGKPCFAIPGNHDSSAFWEGWYGVSNDKVRDYSVTDKKSGLKIIALDSRGGPYGSGILSAVQLKWLREQVQSGGECIILLHHTPHIGNVEYLTYQMYNSHEFYNAVRGANVLGVFAGHTHICYESFLGDIPCHTAPSITFGLITEEHSMTAVDKTGYNYCTYSHDLLTVRNIELPGTGASASLNFEEPAI